LASAALAAPLSASAAGQPQAVTVEYGIDYAPGLQMDVARPRNGNGPWPGVLCLHGGAWRAGHRDHLSRPNIVFVRQSLIERLASRGYVAASASYRLVPDVRFPDMLYDAKAAVRFLRRSAGRFHLRSDRLAAMGVSAGGHLACLLGLTRPADGLEGPTGTGDVSSAVQAVASYFGPTDFTMRTWSTAADDAVFEPLIGRRFTDDPEAYRRASPVNYVHADASPFLFVHGTNDPVVDLTQSHTLADNLRECGVSARMIEVPGAGHGWIGPTLDRSVDWLIEFLDEVLT
jgi:acetyl esterase/lipase